MNVIVFGESGCGKSSIVNMILGKNEAPVSDDLRGCTSESKCYETRIGNIDYRIYDTAGLNEGPRGRVPHWAAVERLYTLIRGLDSVHLLVYCMRGRLKESTRANWALFHKVICAQEVPIVAVVTGLDSEEKLEGWAERRGISNTFKENAMSPDGVLGVVADREYWGEEEAYIWSQQKLRTLIRRFSERKEWKSGKDEWFDDMYPEVPTTWICGLRLVQLESTVVDKFIEEFMEPGDSEKLKASLLHAERKFQSTKKRGLARMPFFIGLMLSDLRAVELKDMSAKLKSMSSKLKDISAKAARTIHL